MTTTVLTAALLLLLATTAVLGVREEHAHRRDRRRGFDRHAEQAVALLTPDDPDLDQPIPYRLTDSGPGEDRDDLADAWTAITAANRDLAARLAAIAEGVT